MGENRQVLAAVALSAGLTLTVGGCAAPRAERGDATLRLEPSRFPETPLWRLTLPEFDAATNGTSSYTITRPPAKSMYIVLVTDDPRAIDKAFLEDVVVNIRVVDGQGRTRLEVGGQLRSGYRNGDRNGWGVTWKALTTPHAIYFWNWTPHALRFDPGQDYTVVVDVTGAAPGDASLHLAPEFRWQFFGK